MNNTKHIEFLKKRDIHWKIGDYLYITENKERNLQEDVFCKRKISKSNLIKLKLGVSFSKICPDHHNYLKKKIYKVIKVNKYDIIVINVTKEILL